jgi:hypothetical protein
MARCLLAYPSADRSLAATLLVAEAGSAYQYFQRFKKNHPQFGDGSLMSRALALSPQPEPVVTDIDFLHALQTAIEVLLIHEKSRWVSSQL